MCRPCCSLCVYRSRFSDQASYARGKVRAADRESVGTKASGSTIEFRFAHVDDLLVTGTKKFWSETFLPMMQQKFSISFNVLGEVGSEVNFLKRRIKLLEDGIMLTPGTQTAKWLNVSGSILAVHVPRRFLVMQLCNERTTLRSSILWMPRTSGA